MQLPPTSLSETPFTEKNAFIFRPSGLTGGRGGEITSSGPQIGIKGPADKPLKAPGPDRLSDMIRQMIAAGETGLYERYMTHFSAATRV